MAREAKVEVKSVVKSNLRIFKRMSITELSVESYE